MKTAFYKSFARDLKKIKDKAVLEKVRLAIEEVEEIADLSGARDVKKLTGTGNCFRIRVGNYRIGIVLEKDTAEFVRCLHRRDLYRFFP